MKTYHPQEFDIPELKGISPRAIEEHLTLYKGYVTHTNLILQKIEELKDSEEDAYGLAEMQRRFAFEFDGMRNHEYYFKSLEGGAQSIAGGSKLQNAIEEEWGSFGEWLERFKTIAKTRGVGWAMLSYDAEAERLVNGWVDEQHLGHLTGLSPVLALDMWEHSFVGDYWPSGKGQYVDDFFENVNWGVVEENFKSASK